MSSLGLTTMNRSRSILSPLIFLVALCLSSPLSAAAAAAPNSNPLQHCTTIEYCRLCSDSDKSTMGACSETGKIQTMKCPILDEDQDETDEMQTIYASCKRTKPDDEFLLMRFQVLCLLFGSLACLSSKKQKSYSATLFDQRKMSRSSQKQRRRTSELPSDMEMSDLSPPDHGELAALTENDGLEVV